MCCEDTFPVSSVAILLDIDYSSTSQQLLFVGTKEPHVYVYGRPADIPSRMGMRQLAQASTLKSSMTTGSPRSRTSPINCKTNRSHLYNGRIHTLVKQSKCRVFLKVYIHILSLAVLLSSLSHLSQHEL